MIPRLWQNTLLQSSLASRADRYPVEAFRLLVLLNRDSEALCLAELLTDPTKKVQALRLITEQLLTEVTNRESYWLEVLLRTYEVSFAVVKSTGKDSGEVGKLREMLIKAGYWEKAKDMIDAIMESSEREEALTMLGIALVLAQQWDQAVKIWNETEQLISTIKKSVKRTELLTAHGLALVQAQQWD